MLPKKISHGPLHYPVSPEYHHWMFQYQNYTYGLLVSCSEALGLFHIEKVWIVSRSSTISQSAMREIRNDLSRMGLGSRKFSSVSHENCNENDLREHNQKGSLTVYKFSNFNLK